MNTAAIPALVVFGIVAIATVVLWAIIIRNAIKNKKERT